MMDKEELSETLPVLVEGKVIGAVGVSGVTSAQDEQVAQAALRGLGI